MIVRLHAISVVMSTETLLASLEAANEAFVMQSSVGSNYTDDILATFETFTLQTLNKQTQSSDFTTLKNTNAFGHRFISELYRVSAIHPDFSIDPQALQLISNYMIARCLSIQSVLGYFGQNERPTISSLVASTVMSERYVALAFTSFLNTKQRPEIELSNPGIQSP